MEPSIQQNLKKYDVVQMYYVTVSGVVNSVLHTRQQLEKTGVTEIPNNVNNNNPLQALLYDEPSLAGKVVIDYTTLTPLPWMSRDDQRVGGVMCHVDPTPGADNSMVSARGSAVSILQKLRDEGLTIKSAIEAEFVIYESDGESYFNNFPMMQYGRVDNFAGKESLLLDICLSIQKTGSPIETFMSEFGESQFEITFCPQEGVASADSIIFMKEALKDQLKANNALTSFMACSNALHHANGFHLNHSLWTLDNKNAFLDESDPKLMSSVLRHWIAGLILHSPALCALTCPTVNCYRRFQVEEMCPSSATWGIENRTTLLRIKNDNKNVYVENRLPSSACNPYLALASTVAAGLDGIVRKLECPMALDGTNAPKMPRSLEEAMDCLEKDDYMMEAIGRKVVTHFIQMNRKFLKAQKDGRFASIKDEREVFFHVI